MKIWTVAIALAAFVAVATAAPSSSTTSKVVVKAAGKSTGNQCVPEPMTMLALIPGVALLIRRRKQA